MKKPSRREILSMGASVAAGLTMPHLLTGCGSDASSSSQSSEPPPADSIPCSTGDGALVAVAQGINLDTMTRSALSLLGGIQTVVKPGDTIFIKPNMVTLPWASSQYNPFALGECTKPEIVIAVMDECLKAGASKVIVGDGSQMPRFDWSGATTLDGSTNLADAAARLSAQYSKPVQLACLDVDSPNWVEIPVGTSLGKVLISSLVTDADKVISIPVAKTHQWAYLTLALKNFIGITPLERYGWTDPQTGNTRVLLHANDPSASQGFGRLFVDIAKAVKPDLAIIDMSIGIEGNGPSISSGGITADMKTRHGSWILLASTDAVAADATAARVLNQESQYIESILAMAHAAGMGTICEAGITLLGATLDQLRVKWQPAQVAMAMREPLLWPSRMKHA